MLLLVSCLPRGERTLSEQRRKRRSTDGRAARTVSAGVAQ